MKFLKQFAKVIAYLVGAVVLGVALAAGIVSAIPDHQVEFTATGDCKKVEYRGQFVPNGCQQVADRKITRYDHVYGGR